MLFIPSFFFFLGLSRRFRCYFRVLLVVGGGLQLVEEEVEVEVPVCSVRASLAKVEKVQGEELQGPVWTRIGAVFI